ncbi:hypothetical protein NC652_003944 [Populus alba x Populus x berolinensis]|nr:hypothetical protein NC652_003944 [Populus alba x Populus x berolinensis]
MDLGKWKEVILTDESSVERPPFRGGGFSVFQWQWENSQLLWKNHYRLLMVKLSRMPWMKPYPQESKKPLHSTSLLFPHFEASSKVCVSSDGTPSSLDATIASENVSSALFDVFSWRCSSFSFLENLSS